MQFCVRCSCDGIGRAATLGEGFGGVRNWNEEKASALLAQLDTVGIPLLWKWERVKN